MRAGVCNMVFLCALLVLGFSAPARADGGLCNRFMAALARALGNPTEEFKRRVAFLLETGKIDLSSLGRMVVSDVAISPFKEGTHHGSEVVPHERAITSLLAKGNLDWKEIRRFVEEQIRELEKSNTNATVHRKATTGFFRPQLVATFESPARPGKRGIFSPVMFRHDRVTYLAVGSSDSRFFIVEAVSGKLAYTASLADKSVASELAVFEKDGKTYLASLREFPLLQIAEFGEKSFVGEAGKEGASRHSSGMVSGAIAFEGAGGPQLAVFVLEGGGGAVNIVDPVARKVIYKIEIPYLRFQTPAIAKIGDTPILIAHSCDNKIYFIDCAAGRIVGSLQPGGSLHSDIHVFEDNGSPQAVVVQDLAEAVGSRLLIVDVAARKIVRTIEIPRRVVRAPTVITEKGGVYLAAAASDGRTYVVDARSGLKVGERESGDTIEGLPAVIEKKGTIYLLSGTERMISLAPLWTKETFFKYGVGDKINSAVVFEDDGMTYAALKVGENRVSIFRLYGPKPEGKER